MLSVKLLSLITVSLSPKLEKKSLLTFIFAVLPQEITINFSMAQLTEILKIKCFHSLCNLTGSTLSAQIYFSVYCVICTITRSCSPVPSTDSCSSYRRFIVQFLVFFHHYIKRYRIVLSIYKSRHFVIF